MKKTIKVVTFILTLVLVGSTLVACSGSGDLSGKYTQVIDSLTYFSTQEVQNDMPEQESRPDGSEARVGFRRLMGMLDSRVADDAAVISGGTAPAAAGVSEYYTVTLELTKDTYKLTKNFNVDMGYVSDEMKNMADSGVTPSLNLVFSGSCTSDGNTVTLEVPNEVTVNVSPCGGMADAYTRFGGTFRDVNETAQSDTEFPGRFFYYFNTPYFIESSSVSNMTVTVDKDAGTLSFN